MDFCFPAHCHYNQTQKQRFYNSNIHHVSWFLFVPRRVPMPSNYHIRFRWSAEFQTNFIQFWRNYLPLYKYYTKIALNMFYVCIYYKLQGPLPSLYIILCSIKFPLLLFISSFFYCWIYAWNLDSRFMNETEAKRAKWMVYRIIPTYYIYIQI